MIVASDFAFGCYTTNLAIQCQIDFKSSIATSSSLFLSVPADPAKAAWEGNAALMERDRSEGRQSVLDALDRRWELALHSFGVSIPPAIIANAAIFTVEEAALLYTLLRNRRERREANEVLTNPKASQADRAAASRRLIAAGGGDRDNNVSRFLHQSLELAVKSACAVPLEAVFSAVGSFLWPGTGTWLLGALGACVVWL